MTSNEKCAEPADLGATPVLGGHRSRRGAWNRSTRIVATAAAVLVGLAVASPVAGAAPSAPTAGCAASASTSGISTDEQQFLDLLNTTRAAAGRSAVVINTEVSVQSRDWSAYMAETNVLQHARTSNGIPAGMDYVDLVTEVVPNWQRVGENVGRGATVRGLHDAFVASSGHYANMVGDFNQVGIGSVVEGGTMWVTVRFVKGPAPRATSVVATVAPPNFTSRTWNTCVGDVPLVGDFDGNGYDDTLFYGRGSAPDSLVMNSAGGPSVKSLSIGGDYRPFVADFNGDGRDDVSWYAPGPRPDSFWYGAEGGTFTSRTLTITGDYVPLVGDYNGDGLDDIFLYAPGPEPDYFWYSTTGGFRSVNQNVYGSYPPQIADFDGNGHDDIFWYAPGPAQDSVWYHTPSGIDSRNFRVDGYYQPQLGDFDGDGNSDIFWYAPGPESDSLWFNHDRTISGFTRNVNGRYGVLIGDYDGNGVDDMMFSTPTGGPASAWLFGATRAAFSSHGGSIGADAVGAVGDFDGNGRDDVIWRQPGSVASVAWMG